MSDPRSLVNLPPSLSIFLLERVGRRARARAFVQGTPPGRGKRGLGRMVGVGQIPGSEVANTVEVVGMAAYTNTTARELKVEEIAGSVGGGGAVEVVGASGRRGGAAGGGRARQFNRNGRTRHIWRASDTLCAFRSLFSPSKNVSRKFVTLYDLPIRDSKN